MGRPLSQTWRALWRGAAAAAVVLGGVWLGLYLGARADTHIGPLEVTLSLGPSLTGDSVVRVPPLGSLLVDSHDAPLRLTAEIRGINVEDARAIFDDPTVLNGLEDRVFDDLGNGLSVLVARAIVAGGIGGALGALLVLRRPRGLVIAAGGAAAALMIGSVAGAAVTLDREALLQPRYEGLLSIAPSMLGSAETIVANFDDYREGLASMVTQVSRLFDVTSSLPAYAPSDDVTRVLHVSDLHVNPASWAIIRSVVREYDIDVVVDTGDTVHQGSAVENAYVDQISTVRIPYVWVRGNHDSALTERAVKAEPNAVVLDDGETARVAGLTFFGVGDPRFTPDKTRADTDLDEVREFGAAAAEAAAAAGVTADLALTHDPRLAANLGEVAPLVLCGHMHSRARALLPSGAMFFQQGSSGGSGPNALLKEEPTPITMTVLYLDDDTHELEAWDDLTFGGIGRVSAEVERRVASSFADDADLIDVTGEPAAGGAGLHSRVDPDQPTTPTPRPSPTP